MFESVSCSNHNMVITVLLYKPRQTRKSIKEISRNRSRKAEHEQAKRSNPTPMTTSPYLYPEHLAVMTVCASLCQFVCVCQFVVRIVKKARSINNNLLSTSAAQLQSYLETPLHSPCHMLCLLRHFTSCSRNRAL